MRTLLRAAFALGMGILTTAAPAPFLAGCSPSGIAQGSRSTGASVATSGVGIGLPGFPAERYFPLKRFFAWIYSVTIKSKDGSTAVEDTYRIETLEEGSSRNGTISLKRTAGGALLFEGQGTVTMTSAVITRKLVDQSETIQLPLQPDLEWTSGTLTARTFKVDKLVAGGQPYTDLIGISYSRDGEVVAVRWLAPKKGIVKELTRTKTDDGDIETVAELKKAYTVGVAAVSLSPTSTISLSPAATAAASAILRMDEDGLTSQEITFSSSNQAVATIAKIGTGITGLKAVVTGVAAGSAILTARSDQDPTKVATVSVIVN